MSKAAQGFLLRRTEGTPQTAFSQAAGANPRRTPLIGRPALLGNKRAIYGWKLVNPEPKETYECQNTIMT